MDELLKIIHFMIEAFGSIWPYLLITIPLAVAVQMAGAARYINRTFQARPLVAILLATAVGAFSPFCSASVIPVVASLLIGGVPLAPVMAFWIASPLMDPEIFFLSVATIGWELAVWRLGGTLLLSLSAGLLTHLVFKRGWLGRQILRSQQPPTVKGIRVILRQGWQGLRRRLAFTPAVSFATKHTILAAEAASCRTTADVSLVDRRQLSAAYPPAPASSGNETGRDPVDLAKNGGNCHLKPASFRRRLLSETGQASLMMAKFMALAFFLEALITLYIPAEWIAGLIGRQNEGAIITRLDTLKDDRRLRSWIYQITRNAITDYYRTHRIVAELDETFSIPDMDASARARQEIGSCLLPMIERLPAHYRQAVMLSEIEGLKQREVAIKQGISLSGAKSRVQRGRKMLKKMLMAGCHFEFDHRGTVIDCQEKGPNCNGAN